MLSRLLALLVVLSVAACGGERRPDTEEEGTPDAGHAPDAGNKPDAGNEPDGGSGNACQPNPCNEAFRTRCRVSGTTAICSCDEGYRDEGDGCEPIPGNPCAPNPCTGSHRTSCTVVDDAAVCACDEGYRLEGSACVPATSTDACDPTPCTQPHRTSCSVSNGEAVCACDQGYRLEGGSCVLVATDPCAPNPCTQPHRTICSAAGGEAVCACNPGYVLEGSACVTATCSGGILSTTISISDVAASSEPDGDTAVVWTGSNYVVLWSEARGTPASELWAAKVKSDGTKDGPDVRLTSAAGISLLDRHGVVPLPNGFAIAWIDGRYTANRKDVVFARFDQNMQRVGTESRVTTNLSVEQVALTATNGGYVVAWSSPLTTGAETSYQRLDAQGAPVGAVTTLNSELSTDVALASNGTVCGLAFARNYDHHVFVIAADGTYLGSPNALSGDATSTDVVWTGSEFVALALKSASITSTLDLTSFDTSAHIAVDSVTILTAANGIYASAAAWSGGKLGVLTDVFPSSALESLTQLHRYNAGGVELDLASDLVRSARSIRFSVGAGATGLGTAWVDFVGTDKTVMFRHWCE